MDVESLLEPEPAELHSFDKIRCILHCHEGRARIFHRMRPTVFFGDRRIVAVHVDNTARADRACLTAFDRHGQRISGDCEYIDHIDERLDCVTEFDHVYTRLGVAGGSPLEDIINNETGWVIDMAALRTYDITADQRRTERRMFLGMLGDMAGTGQLDLRNESQNTDSDHSTKLGFRFVDNPDEDQPDAA